MNKIKNRAEMAQMLQERMTNTYGSLLEKQELEPDTTLVKTYLKEAHVPERGSANTLLNSVRGIFSDETARKKLSLKVRRTEEDSFFLVEGTVDREPITIYLDASNPRFWLLHSMNSSGALDSLLERLVSMTPLIDNAWIPIHILESVASLGRLRGLGIDYDRRIIADVDFDADETPVEFLKMQLWGNKASEVLRILRQEEAFPHEATLSKVKIKKWLDHESPETFSIDDIKYDGKLTARGTSFAVHINIVDEVSRRYRETITSIERKFRLYWQAQENRTCLRGEPVNLVFGRPIPNLESFCAHIFNCSAPFRLWGVPTYINDNYVRVNAVDLHVGRTIVFEITNEYIRMYLPSDGCGNSIVRLVTNLQHYYDSMIEVHDGDDRSIFS